MAFWDLKTVKLEAFRPGIVSKAEIGDNLIMVFMEIEAGKEDTGHRHQHDQCGIILSGKIHMFIGEVSRTLTSDESYFIPAGVKHGWKTFDKPVRLLDVSIKES